jgi:flagellar assembly protein FliH
MSGPLLKTPAAPLGAAATLAGHPRAGTSATIAAAAPLARVASAPSPMDEARVAQRRTDEELDALRQAARDEGLREGRLEAQRQVEQAMSRHDETLKAMAAGIEASVRDRLDHLEEFALAIAYQACGIVLSQAALDGCRVADTVRALLQPLRQAGGVRVRLHPDDLARVTHAFRDDPRQAVQALRFEADTTLARGDCHVVTTHGHLESGLAIQLDAIRDSLLATHAALQSNEDAT